MPKGIYTRGIINRQPLSEETKNKISLAHKGKVFSAETREKMRSVKTGCKYPNRKKYFKGITIRSKICEFCKKEYTPPYNNYARNRFCSRSCVSKSHPPGRLGKPNSEKQIAMAKLRKGELHPRWIKDRTEALDKKRIRNVFEVKEWRTSVFHRDDFVCQECGVRGGKLEAHHIKPWRLFRELRHEVNNGITLCRPCHLKTLQKEDLFEEKYSKIILTKL
jgi:5-methylcytosine-specific restriction endonuclease McrA